jgi:hypothetical protein
MRPMTHDELLTPAAAAGFKPWRAALSLVLAVAVLLASLHHLSCLGEDELAGPASSTAVALEKSTPPLNGDQCLPGHCHCVCHVSVQSWSDVTSSPVEFGKPAYGPRTAPVPHGLAALPPFKPPQA